MDIKINGPLLIIGGAEDKQNKKVILKRFWEMCGETQSRIGIATPATKEQEAAAQTYSDIFQSFGVQHIEPLLLKDRSVACQQNTLDVLEKLSGVFFTGGDQLRISGIISGTPFEKLLFQRNKEGMVIAGTSAGASMMSAHMIVGGANDETATKDIVKIAPGLGLIYGVVIDQHFAQRGRVGRLLAVIAQSPQTLAVGIDEDTAIEVTQDGVLNVIGSQTITILDGQSISFSNASEQSPEQPLALANVNLHTLCCGYSFDLEKRQVVSNQNEV